MSFPDNSEPSPAVEVSFEALSEDALLGVIGDFILREGTEYGHREVAYDQKVNQVLRQIKSGDAKIFYDPNTNSVTLSVDSIK